MTVSIEIPDHVATELERVEQRFDFAIRDLSLSQRVATATIYALYTCGQTDDPNELDRFVNLALQLASEQPFSNE